MTRLAEPISRQSLAPPNAWDSHRLAAAQGAYYVGTGVWTLLGARSRRFAEAPRTNTWLRMLLGALATTSGAALLQASRQRERPSPLVALGSMSAAALAAVDFACVAKRRVSPIHALDGIAETAILTLWLNAWVEAGIAADQLTLTSAPSTTW
jgi:hypothetical protein